MGKGERFNELSRLMEASSYFKVVCGAGNEDAEEVRRLSLVYTLAGVVGIDVSANREIVLSSVEGINLAFEIAQAIGIHIENRPFINVSVGLKGDPHVRKALIDENKCTQCGRCVETCDQDAIDTRFFHVLSHRCIGCGQCFDACEFDAVGFYSIKVDFHDILPGCIGAGAETLELHAIVADNDSVMRDWKTISDILPHQFISMCIDRSQISDEHLIDRIRQASEIAGERFIVQADGAPMSGGMDSFNTTLQAVACADLVQKSGIPAKILVSGGTNSMTGELVRLCNLRVHGISVGTFARKLVRDEIRSREFESDIELVLKAVKKSEWLVKKNLDFLSKA